MLVPVLIGMDWLGTQGVGAIIDYNDGHCCLCNHSSSIIQLPTNHQGHCFLDVVHFLTLGNVNKGNSVRVNLEVDDASASPFVEGQIIELLTVHGPWTTSQQDLLLFHLPSSGFHEFCERRSKWGSARPEAIRLLFHLLDPAMASKEKKAETKKDHSRQVEADPRDPQRNALFRQPSGQQGTGAHDEGAQATPGTDEPPRKRSSWPRWKRSSPILKEYQKTWEKNKGKVRQAEDLIKKPSSDLKKHNHQGCSSTFATPGTPHSWTQVPDLKKETLERPHHADRGGEEPDLQPGKGSLVQVQSDHSPEQHGAGARLRSSIDTDFKKKLPLRIGYGLMALIHLLNNQLYQNIPEHLQRRL